jgi:nitroreductase
VYHYDQPAHALRRLATGDLSPRVRRALGTVTTEGGQFLLVTVRFWQNAFKYAEFSYHCVTMDLGCLLRTWQTWAAACGIALGARLWFDEPELDRLLGLDPARESVLAVVPLPWSADSAPGRSPVAHSAAAWAEGATPVTAPVVERSRTVLRFPAAEAAHLAAAYDTGPCPVREVSAKAAAELTGTTAAETVRLPEPTELGGSVAEALTARRSSFGRFSAHRPLAAEDLAALLDAATTGARSHSTATGTAPLTRTAVFVQHVAGLRAGPYLHDPEAQSLIPLAEPAPHPFLQRAYTLNNYNLEQAAAVLIPLGRPHAAVAAAGPRGYRLLNAEVGAVAQSVYLAAAALGTGCGAALGFDYEALRRALAPALGPDTWPLLLLMAGHERPDPPGFDAPLTLPTPLVPFAARFPASSGSSSSSDSSGSSSPSGPSRSPFSPRTDRTDRR